MLDQYRWTKRWFMMEPRTSFGVSTGSDFVIKGAIDWMGMASFCGVSRHSFIIQYSFNKLTLRSTSQQQSLTFVLLRAMNASKMLCHDSFDWKSVNEASDNDRLLEMSPEVGIGDYRYNYEWYLIPLPLLPTPTDCADTGIVGHASVVL